MNHDRRNVVVIQMEPRHWERVRAIYVEGLATGRAGFETRAPEWPEWNAAHLQHSRLVAVARRAEGGATDRREAEVDERQVDDDTVVGWVALSSVSARQCYAGVAEVSIYVATEAQGTGIGKLLLTAAIRQSEAAGIWTLQAVVFPENSSSVRLHERCGFRVAGRRERIARRDGTWHDTLLLERRSRVVGVDPW